MPETRKRFSATGISGVSSGRCFAGCRVVETLIFWTKEISRNTTTVHLQPSTTNASSHSHSHLSKRLQLPLQLHHPPRRPINPNFTRHPIHLNLPPKILLTQRQHRSRRKDQRLKILLTSASKAACSVSAYFTSLLILSIISCVPSTCLTM